MEIKVQIQNRFKNLLFLIIKEVKTLPYSEENKIIRRQIIRSSSSSAANYRAAYRAKSKADFIHKLKIVEEEIDETQFWLEILDELPSNQKAWTSLTCESNELTAIIVSSIKTIRKTR